MMGVTNCIDSKFMPDTVSTIAAVNIVISLAAKLKLEPLNVLRVGLDFLSSLM
jgi:hypothetical protein